MVWIPCLWEVRVCCKKMYWNTWKLPLPGSRTKSPFPMKRKPSPLPNSSPQPEAWALLWPSEAPGKMRRWWYWSTTGQPIWPPVSVLYMQGISMSRWTVRCPCPGCVPFWKPSPPPPWYMTRRRRRPPKPWRSTVPSSWTGRGLPARRIYPSWLPGAGACWTSTRCTPSLPLAPPVPPKGSSSPTEASLTSSNGWRRPARSPGKTSWATRPPFTLTCR